MNTVHANVRCQQRGIPPIVVDMLLQFGRRDHDHAGAEIVYFDSSAKKKIEKYTGSLIGKFNEHLDSYVVMAGGAIVTVGTRYKRIKRL
jgi:UDP-N-acetylglucosamine transferase subunit ALG13